MLYDTLWDTPPTVDDVIGTPAAWFDAYGQNCLFATGYTVNKSIRDYFEFGVIGHSDHFPQEVSLWPNYWKKEHNGWLTVICDIAEVQYDRDYGPPVDKIRAMHEEAVRRYEAYQKALTKKPPTST